MSTVNNSNLGQIFSYIKDVSGKSVAALKTYSAKASYAPDLTGLAINLLKCGEICFGTTYAEAIKFATEGRDFSGVYAASGYAFRLYRAGTYTEFMICSLKGIKYGRGFIAGLGKRQIIQFTGFDKFTIHGHIAGLVASGLEFYEAGFDVVHSYTLESNDMAMVGMTLDQKQVAVQSVRRQNFVKVVKAIVSIAGAIFSIAAIYTGAAVVAGIVTLVLSTIASVCSVVKGFTEAYGDGVSLANEKRIKAELVNMRPAMFTGLGVPAPAASAA